MNSMDFPAINAIVALPEKPHRQAA